MAETQSWLSTDFQERLIPPSEQPNTNPISVSNGDSVKRNYTPPAFLSAGRQISLAIQRSLHPPCLTEKPPHGLDSSQWSCRPAFGVENIGPGGGRPFVQMFQSVSRHGHNTPWDTAHCCKHLIADDTIRRSTFSLWDYRVLRVRRLIQFSGTKKLKTPKPRKR